MEYTEENFLKLQDEILQIKKAQSGSDKAVKALQDENAALKGEQTETALETEKKLGTEKQKADLFDRKLQVFELAKDNNIDINTAFELLGFTELTDQERLENYAGNVEKIHFDEAQKFVKANGTRPHRKSGLAPARTNIFDYSDKEVAAMPPQMFEKLQDRSKPEKGKKKTFADRVRSAIS